jgi:hypothetical protein
MALARVSHYHARAMALERSGCLLFVLLAGGCGEPLALGSDLIWSADHEGGDLGDWSLESRGGAHPGPESGSSIEISSERARRGSYSVKLTRPAVGADAGPLLFRELGGARAYYSAWYSLPSAPQSISYWTIAQFRAQPASDPDAAPHGVNLNLKVLPGGQMVLVAFDNDEAQLQAPLADPTPFVPIGGWFHVEALYENGGAAPGRLTVWLDGTRVYEMPTGALVGGADSVAYYMPCNVAKDLGPEPAVIFVDDVAISAVRVTPDGVLELE